MANDMLEKLGIMKKGFVIIEQRFLKYCDTIKKIVPEIQRGLHTRKHKLTEYCNAIEKVILELQRETKDSFLWLYNNLFTYEKTMNFTTSHTNCEHSIGYYTAIAKKQGYVSPLIKSKNPIFPISVPEPGQYSLTGSTVASCPDTITKQVEFTDSDLKIRRAFNRYGKEVWQIIGVISRL